MEDTVLTNVVDDLHITQHFETFVPDCASDVYCKPESEVVEVKKEELQNMEAEPTNESHEDFSDYSVKVRIRFLTFDTWF